MSHFCWLPTPGETRRLVALAVDANGVAIPNLKFKWEMLEPLAGSISQDGRLTASANIGTFPSAIQVTLVPEKEDIGEKISTSLDVLIIDSAGLAQQISATVLPKVISLRPKEEIRFTSMVLDRRGNQIPTLEPRWEILDARAGVISNDGRFKAGEEPGIYSDAIHVSMGVTGVDEKVVATGTVIIVDVTSRVIPQPEQQPRVAIFPGRIVLSPGESIRAVIVGLNGNVQELSTANVRWSLTPPEVGEVSQFVTVTAHNFPGIYEGAIRASVTLQTASGPVIQELSATMIIRDTLATVEIAPQAATLARGEKMQFRAIAYDKNNILLSDVSFRWSVTDPALGTIDQSGLFTADGSPGEYPGAVQVQASQRRRSSLP